MILASAFALFLLLIVVAINSALGISNNPLSTIGFVRGTQSSLYQRSSDPVSRIIGGKETPIGSFPFQVSLQNQVDDGLYVHICGGSIVGSEKMVTAAHCRSRRNVKYVGETSQYRNVCSFTVHPNFNYSSRDFDYDYAVVRLCKPFHFSSAVNAVTMTNLEPSSGICRTSGWGDIKTPDETIVPTPRLHNVSILLVPRPDCAAENAKVGLQITDRMVCSGGDGKGICFNDDGSGLVCEDGKLAGIDLYGGFPRAKAPSLFANVAEGRTWLDSQ